MSQKQGLNKKSNKKEWGDMSSTEKTTGIVILAIIVLVILWIIGGVFGGSTDNQQANNQTTKTENKTEEKPKAEVKSPKEKMLDSIVALMDTKQAFDTGSYVKGDIPKGEYAFVPFDGSGQYYSEEDSAGNIVDNENFDGFGYVYVHGVGNIQTDGVLVSVSAFKKLDVKSAKEIYEKLNNESNYKDSAMYKVGTDIKPGSYTIESYGEAYVEVMSGPVGNSEIVNNEIFKGKYSVSVSNGQYLKVSKGRLL